MTRPLTPQELARLPKATLHAARAAKLARDRNAKRGVRAGQLYRSRTQLNTRGWRYVKILRVSADPPMATVREVGPGGKPVRGLSPVPGLVRGAPFPVYLRYIDGCSAMPEDFEAVLK